MTEDVGACDEDLGKNVGNKVEEAVEVESGAIWVCKGLRNH